MFSVVIDGNVKDLRFKKVQDGHYFGYLDEIFIGQYFKLKTGWAVVGDYDKMNGYLNNVKGFRTRLDAVEYILSCYKLIPNQ